jgi:hypothetical protein
MTNRNGKNEINITQPQQRRLDDPYGGIRLARDRTTEDE